MLKPNAERILRAIAEEASHDLDELPVIEIARRAHVSERTVRRYIVNLKAHGYITAWRECPGTPYIFEILPKAHAELDELKRV